MNNYDILHGKLPSPINKIKNSNINLTLKEENINLTLKEENINLRDELNKLKKAYDIISKKLKILEQEVCCGCCGLRWAVTLN